MQNILNEQFWYMCPDALQVFMSTLHDADLKKESFNPEMISLFDDDDDQEKKPYRIEKGIAVIDIHGPLIKRARGFFARLFGIVGMVQIGETFQSAMLDPDIKGVFLDVDSPGGSVSGTSDLADIIFEARGTKPILTFADDQMTSAAQWIGGSADFVAVANESTRLGSVGVVGVHFDFVDRAKELGIRPTVFSAGKFKAIGNQFEHLSGDDKKYIQSQFSYLHSLFIDAVARNTGIPKSKLNSDLKEARVFMGSQGIKVGLAHKIMNRSQAMALLSDVVDGKTTFEEHKPKMESITFQGGDNNMDLEQKIKDLELSGKDLETKLEAAQSLISEMKASGKTDELNAKITEITAEKEALQADIAAMVTASDTLKAENETAVAALNTEIETMKTSAKDNEVFVSAGKNYIDTIKADIKKTSVQVDGNDYNETLVDKQLEAFGTDIEMLTKFKTNLETRRASMVKAGDIKPDESTGTQSQEKTEQEKYELGGKVVPMRMRVKE